MATLDRCPSLSWQLQWRSLVDIELSTAIKPALLRTAALLLCYPQSIAVTWKHYPDPWVAVPASEVLDPVSNMPTIKHPVKINVDLGEGYGNFKCGPDEELIPLIDHANVACGFHAGDPIIMQETVKLCKQHDIAVGAHPGLPDIQGFGRREIKMSGEELTAMTRYQIGALQAFLDAEGLKLHHVKPHGVLYGMMYRDKDICRAVYSGVPPGTPVFGLAGTYHEEAAKELGLPFVAELYGDVKYNVDKTLVIDRKKKAWAMEDVTKHIRSQVQESSVTAVTGETVTLPLGDHHVSLCCHSDSPGCVEIVKTARRIVDEFNRTTFGKQ